MTPPAPEGPEDLEDFQWILKWPIPPKWRDIYAWGQLDNYSLLLNKETFVIGQFQKGGV